MTVESQELRFRTQREGEILDITRKIQRVVESSKLKDGVVTLFVPGSTGALTTIEYEPGLLTDFPLALERLAPKDAPYEHENRWHDGNGHSHVRASMIGPDLSVPFLDKKLGIGNLATNCLSGTGRSTEGQDRHCSTSRRIVGPDPYPSPSCGVL
jgi:secondary thiamine-phosphate synthase enzyme